MASIATALRRRRKELGLDRFELSKRLGLKESDIVSLERGDLRPTPVMIARLTRIIPAAALEAALGKPSKRSLKKKKKAKTKERPTDRHGAEDPIEQLENPS